jgi:hypothetical protein
MMGMNAMGAGGGGMMNGGMPMINGYNGIMPGGQLGQMGQMGMGQMGGGWQQQPGMMGQGNLAMGMIPMGGNGMAIAESQAAPVSFPPSLPYNQRRTDR